MKDKNKSAVESIRKGLIFIFSKAHLLVACSRMNIKQNNLMARAGLYIWAGKSNSWGRAVLRSHHFPVSEWRSPGSKPSTEHILLRALCNIKVVNQLTCLKNAAGSYQSQGQFLLKCRADYKSARTGNWENRSVTKLPFYYYFIKNFSRPTILPSEMRTITYEPGTISLIFK